MDSDAWGSGPCRGGWGGEPHGGVGIIWRRDGYRYVYYGSSADMLEAGEVDGKFVPTAFDYALALFQGSVQTADGSYSYDYQYDEAGNSLGYTYSFDEQYSFAYLTDINTDISTVPEPASLLLLGTGLVGVVGAARRYWKQEAAA